MQLPTWSHTAFFTLLLSLPGLSLAQSSEEDELGIVFSEEPLVVQEQDKPKDDNWQFRGFFDARWGTRFLTDSHFDNQDTLFEARLQGATKFNVSEFKVNIKADLLYDDILQGSDIDLREAYIELPSNEYANIRIGRQNIVWGLGDMVVANDVFPKDFMALYRGMDAEAEYMVAPSDGLRASIFLDNATLDFAYTRFSPWNTPKGERFSYYNPFMQATVGEDNILNIDEDNDGVLMVRYSRELFGQEFAFYANRSRWQSPEGFSPQTGTLYYPRLNTYGFSLRGEAGPGILSFETAYYDSVEDPDGDKYWVRNSETRFILGYSMELAQELSASVQWYREQQRDHSRYVDTLPQGAMTQPQHYDLLTLRLRQMLLSQKMTLSLFWFYSPTDNDGYVRLNLFHKFDDHWMVNIGTNHFNGGVNDRFGQLQGNSNYFAAIRYSF